MAKALEAYKSEWEAVKKGVTTGLEEIKKDAQAIAQTSGVMQEGTKELGLRVQELKDLGMKGATVNDFSSDAEVKAMMTSINGFMAQIKTELTRIKGLYDGSFKKTKENYWNLKKALTAEVAEREKATSTKLGTGNKSLPDLKKLKKEVDDYENGTFATFDAFVPETVDEHSRSLARWIATELAKTKAEALTAFQQEMDMQALNIRVFNTHIAKAKTLLETVQTGAGKLEKAVAERKLADYNAAKTGISAALKDLAALDARFKNALTDDWVKGRLKMSKDKSAIEAGVKFISDAHVKAHAIAVKAASLQIKALPPVPKK